MSNRRFLFVIHYPVFGGPHNQALRLAGPLAERGWETVVLLPDEPGNAATRLQEAGVHVVTAPLVRIRAIPSLRVQMRTVARLRPDVRAIRRAIADEGADLVLLGGLANAQAAFAGRAAQVPVVWQLLDTRMPAALSAAYFPLLARYADSIMVTGHRVARAHPGVPLLRSRTVPFFPPVDRNLFAPSAETRAASRTELGLHGEGAVIGIVGNLSPMKGHGTFLQVAAQVQRLHPDARFLILGADFEYRADYSRSLWEEAERLGLSLGETLIVRDPADRIPELAQALDVLVVTSEPRSEGLPTVIGEMMALGKPVVAADVGGVREAVSDGVDGFVVPARDVTAFTTAIARLLDDRELFTRMSSAALEGANRYSTERSADAHVEAFTLANDRKRGPKTLRRSLERRISHSRFGPVARTGAAGRSFFDYSALLFLSKYYVKNLALTRVYGRTSGLFLETTRTRWEELYAQIKGHDAWLVVGNGPSLRLDDLEAFDALGVPSIASNKINMVFTRTTWRPKLFTIADPLLLHKLPAQHYGNIERLLLPHTQALMAKTPRKLPWRQLPDAAGEEKYLAGREELHPLNGFFEGGTITVPNLQLAIWAGAKIVYVIGCDHFYANETSQSKSKKSTHQGSSNHFDPNYRQPGEIVNEAAIGHMNRGYATMRKIAEQRGVRIVNISRTSALDEYERDTVENALASVKKAQAQTV
jgi:glycosyltransferase involved in cell wall biosynthesis